VDFGQLVPKRLKLADPLLDEAQLVGDERSQPGPYPGTSSGSKLTDQGFEVSQRETQSTGAADKHQPIHIRTRILSVS